MRAQASSYARPGSAPLADVDRRDDLDRAAQVVEHHDRVGDGEAELGQAQVVGLRARAAARSCARCRSPASRPRRRRSAAARAAPPASASPGSRRGSAAARRPSTRSATRKPPSSAGCSTSTDAAARAHHGARPHAREAVRRPLVAADHALEQERVRSAPELRVRGHRRVGVRQDLPIDERQPPPAGQVEKPGAIRDESHEPDTIAFRASTTRICGLNHARRARSRRLSWCANNRRPLPPPTCLSKQHPRQERSPAASSPGRCGTASCCGRSRSCWRSRRPGGRRTFIGTCAARSRSCCRARRPASSPSTSSATGWPGLQYLGVLVDVGSPDRLAAGESFLDDLAARVRAYPQTEVSDVRTGFATERAFVENHARRAAGPGGSEDDPPAHRGPPALGVRQGDGHAARRQGAGAAARLLGHREEVLDRAGRVRPGGDAASPARSWASR